MPRYVCLLRGVNLGSRRKVSMKVLKELLEGLGCEDVETYIQSGNAVLTAPARSSPARVASAIENRIAEELDLEVDVLIRTARELAEIVEANPFVEQGADPATLHVTFLARRPDGRRLSQVGQDGFAPDEFRVRGREIYLHCPDGYGRTKLNNAFWERQAGVPATTRNWKTVTTLRQLADPAARAAPATG